MRGDTYKTLTGRDFFHFLDGILPRTHKAQTAGIGCLAAKAICVPQGRPSIGSELLYIDLQSYGFR